MNRFLYIYDMQSSHGCVLWVLVGGWVVWQGQWVGWQVLNRCTAFPAHGQNLFQELKQNLSGPLETGTSSRPGSSEAPLVQGPSSPS